MTLFLLGLLILLGSPAAAQDTPREQALCERRGGVYSLQGLCWPGERERAVAGQQTTELPWHWQPQRLDSRDERLHGGPAVVCSGSGSFTDPRRCTVR